nr:MAG: hypothetical protein DIU78_12405 [Pseudomonadota bacterium]
MGGVGGTSTAFFCPEPVEGATSYGALDVWSDAGGVFVRVGARLYADLGDGWFLFDEGRSDTGGLTGYEDGPLLRYGSVVGCGIERIERDGRAACDGAAEAVHVHVVSSELAYAVYGERVLVHNGTYWKQHGEPLGAPFAVGVRQVWADETTLAVAAEAGVYLAQGAEQPVLQTELVAEDGTLPDFSAVWGLPDGTLYAGNRRGEIFAFEAGTWSHRYTTTPGDCAAIRRLWAMGDQLFIATRNEVYSARSGTLEPILDVPCEEAARIGSLWGNAPDDVFILYQTASPDSACGGLALSHYDGRRLRPR